MMKRIEAVLPCDRIQEVERTLAQCGIQGLTLTSVYTGTPTSASAKDSIPPGVPRCKLDVLVSDLDLSRVYRAICRMAEIQPQTEICVTDLVSTIRIRTGEVGEAAIT